jgi:Uma2 family endonuclease
MQTARPRVNYEQLQRMPDDGRRYELHDGVLFEVPAPSLRHQRVVQHVCEVLREYERATGGLVVASPIDVVLDDYHVVQPDVVFLTRDQSDEVDMREAIRTPPALCVEVLSPTTESVDRGWKLRALARFGVREYWLIDANKHTIERYVFDVRTTVLDGVASASDAMTSRALAGLTFPASRVFER